MSEANEQAESGSGSSHCYTAYRAAGELFGRLRESFGFGELVMFTRTWGESAPPRSVAFQWTFKAGDRRYCCEENVAFVELMNSRSAEAFADHLCDKWKREYRKTTAAPAAPNPADQPQTPLAGAKPGPQMIDRRRG